MKIFYDKIEDETEELLSSFKFTEDDVNVSVDSFSGTLHKVSGGDYFLRGRLGVTFTTICDRCLAPAELKIKSSEVSVSVLPGKPADPDFNTEHEITDREADTYSTDPEFLDLDDLLRQEALLLLPIKIVCPVGCTLATEGDDLDETPTGVMGKLAALKKNS